MKSPKAISDKFNALLNLNREIVGVKFFDSSNINCYPLFSGIEVSKPIAYCVAVKSAMAGHSLKVPKDKSGCSGSSGALGFSSLGSDYFSGEQGERMGLFRDRAVSADVNKALPILGNSSADTLAAVIKPLSSFEKEGNPDICLIAANSLNMMRILEGYTFNFGLPNGLCASGNRAVCTECSVIPLKTGSLNVSFLCAGTRYRCRWGDNELMCGFPFSISEDIADGILHTVNAVESDDRKKEIEKKLIETDNLEIEIKYGETYYKKSEK